MTTMADGKPGDIAFGDLNITENPQPTTEVIRQTCELTRAAVKVYRCCLNGEWMHIGYISEHHGHNPEEEEPAWASYPSPNGSIFQEPWFTEEEKKKAFQVWTDSSAYSWSFIRKVLDHYLAYPIPLRPLEGKDFPYTGKGAEPPYLISSGGKKDSLNIADDARRHLVVKEQAMETSEQETPEPRNVGEVISNMMEAIPVEQESLLNRLKATLSSACFRAPETQGDTWAELRMILETSLIPPLTEEWQIKVISIFTTKTEEEVRSTFGVKDSQ